MLRDIRFALRSLLRTPVYTVAAVLMLAVGIGLSIYMFGAINAFALKPLPFADAERLVHFEYTDSRDGTRNLALPQIDWLDLGDRQQSLESLAAYAQGTTSLGGIEGAPERLAGAFVSADALPALGVQPVLGRGLRADDMRAGAPRVVLIGHRVWQLRFNADPNALGRSVRINGEETEIVGVMPEGFAFPMAEAMWLPLSSERSVAAGDAAPRVKTFGKLRAGVSREQAAQEFATLMQGLAVERGAPLRGDRAKLEPFSDEFILPQIREATSAMFIAVLLVLLIACANVASLVLARFAARARELGIRSALGASRRRLVGQVLSETVLVAAAATVVGYAGAEVAARLFDTSMSEGNQLPYWIDFSLDLRDVAFCAGIALVSALLAGLVPALRAGRTDAQESLRDGAAASAGIGRGGRWLVSAEVALCVILLVCAGVAVRSALHAQNTELGIDIDGVLTGRIALFESTYPDAAARLRFVEALKPRLEALPGVERAGFASTLPLMGYERQEYARVGEVIGPDERRPQAWASSIDEGFFASFGIALREGRGFDARDTADSTPVAIVSASFAAAAWPGQSALGQRVQLSPKSTDSPWLEVVGVVADSQQADYVQAGASSARRGDGNVFRPLAQNPPAFVSFAVRARGDTGALAEAVRAAVRSVDADLPVYWLQPMHEWRAKIFWGAELLASMFSAFAVFAVLLAVGGIYAVIAFDVARRTREIGVRRALGAPARGVLALVLRRGVLQVLAGMVIGLPLALAFSRLLGNLMMPGSNADPLVYAGVSALLVLAVSAAVIVPARRALRVDPMVALRHE